MRLKLKGTRFFQDRDLSAKPDHGICIFNVIFHIVLQMSGPINSLLIQMGFITEPYKFLSNVGSTRGLIAFMNCLMWFGNTTILLMAGMMGIDTSLFEAAEVDGATSSQVFWQHHIAAVTSNSCICSYYITDRWTSVIRCATDFDKWYRVTRCVLR